MRSLTSSVAALFGDVPSRVQPTVSYAGFARRGGSLLIDTVLLMIPGFVVYRYGYSQPIEMAGASILLFWFLCVAYFVILHARQGRTVGKMISGIKVRRLDGGSIGYREALLRSSVDIVLVVAGAVALVVTLASWDGPPWSSVDTSDKLELLYEHDPIARVLTLLGELWFWSELVVLLFNEKRRAIHDFIAGTVVVVE